MPSFHGHIYVVTDQIPNWLDISKSKSQLRVISTREIIDKKYLPTFNSHAIEANLHKIPNLKEFYLYFNDDYILGRPVSIDDFFLDGKCPVIYGDDRLTSNTNVTLNIHKKAMLNTNFLLDNFLTNTNRNVNTSDRHFLPHAPHPIRKSIAEEVWSSKFTEIHREQSSHRFRDMNDVHPTYFISRYLIEQSNGCVEERRMKSACPPDGEDFCNQVLKNSLKQARLFFDGLRYRPQMPKFLSDTHEEALITKLLTDYNIDKEHLRHAQTLGEIADLCEKLYIYYIEDILGIYPHDKLLEYREEREKRKTLISTIEQDENNEQPLPTIDDDDQDEDTLIERFHSQLN
ncbi:unnamed protein product [Rotaria sp. Silwood1]|nr:unnamed protein product [Rotaria sp. Silwood1]